MRYRAICPACGTRLCRWWFLSTRWRSCPQCSAPVKRVDAEANRLIGFVEDLLWLTFIFALALSAWTGDAYPAMMFLLFAAPILITVVGTWVSPYYVSFEVPEYHSTRICAACGYDLRATPGRCPECGTVPEKREESAN